MSDYLPGGQIIPSRSVITDTDLFLDGLRFPWVIGEKGPEVTIPGYLPKGFGIVYVPILVSGEVHWDRGRR